MRTTNQPSPSSRCSIPGIRPWMLALALGSVAGLGTCATAQVPYRIIAKSGTDGPLGPQLGVGVRFSGFVVATVNREEQVSFVANLQGTGVTAATSEGLWIASPEGSPLPLARTGTDQWLGPGLGLGVYYESLAQSTIGNPILTDDGHVLHVGRLVGPGVSAGQDSLISLLRQGPLGPLVLGRSGTDGDQGPGLGLGVTWASFLTSLVHVNARGHMLTIARLALPSGGATSFTDGILWRGNSPSQGFMLREGQPTPPEGVLPGAYYASAAPTGDGSPFIRASITDRGVTAFLTHVREPGVTHCLYRFGASNGTPLLARLGSDGQWGPQLGAGVRFSGLLSIQAAGEGHTVFRASLTGPGVTTSNDFGIWYVPHTSSTPSLFLREGMVFSQLPVANQTITTLLDEPVVSRCGTAAVRASTGSTQCYLVGSRPVVASGTDGPFGPRLGMGVVFSSLEPGPSINACGQIAFRAFLSGPGIDGGNQQGVWVTQVDGSLALVVRTGMTIDLDPGDGVDNRTISSIVGDLAPTSGGDSGRRRVFGDDGAIPLLLTFATGGSAVVVFYAPTCVDVVTHPTDASTFVGGTARFFAGAYSATAGTLSYEWRRNDRLMFAGVTPWGSDISGVTSDTLTIANAQPEDEADYHCVVREVCSEAHTWRASLSVSCVSDVDDGTGSGTPDGGVTIDDLLYYLAIFENGEPRSDVDDGSATGTPDGGVTIDDLLYYLFRFESGC